MVNGVRISNMVKENIQIQKEKLKNMIGKMVNE